MFCDYKKGEQQFTRELLKNGDLANPYTKEGEYDLWAGFENSKSAWEQQELARDYQAGAMGV